MIGFGIKRSSYSQIEFPEFHGFMPTLQWRHAVPLPPGIFIISCLFAFFYLELTIAGFHRGQFTKSIEAKEVSTSNQRS